MIENPMEKPQVPPWMQKRLSCLAMGGVVTGAIILMLVAFGALVAVLIAMMDSSRLDFTGVLSGIVLPLILLGGSIFGLVKLWPFLSYGSDFKTAPVEPTTMGRPFETRFVRAGGGSAFIEKGTVTFEADQLVVDGTLGPSPWVILGVILVVTVLPLVMFGCGLGLIPALLLAYFIGRKKTTLRLPYTSLTSLTVDARTVKLASSYGDPGKVGFIVSSADGERLYRELRLHYPQAVSSWTNQLPALA
ncbi:MAG: hypothetical protein ACOYZ8_05890 [Chloroflexota bacterium]